MRPANGRIERARWKAETPAAATIMPAVPPYRTVPVTVVVAASGPLISLAACRRLDLLTVFGGEPVQIADVAKAECTRYLDKIGAADLAAWFDATEGTVHDVVTTGLLPVWEQAVALEDGGDLSRPSKQIGDAAATVVLSLLRSRRPNEVALLLLEDAGLGDGVVMAQHRDVHTLSTRAFLQTLQNYGVIPSAMQIIAEIAAAGRALSRYTSDRPGLLGGGAKTSWASALTGAAPTTSPRGSGSGNVPE